MRSALLPTVGGLTLNPRYRGERLDAWLHVPALHAALTRLADDLRELDGPDGLTDPWARRIDGDAFLLEQAREADSLDELLWAVGCLDGRVTTIRAWLAEHGHGELEQTAKIAEGILMTITDGLPCEG